MKRRLVAPKRHKILHGHVLDVLRTLDTESVQMAVTSPPYYGLRSYSTEPQIWPVHGYQRGYDCVPDGVTAKGRHAWQYHPARKSRWGGMKNLSAKQASNSGAMQANPIQDHGATCSKCSAWLGELGNEPTLELYCQHLQSVVIEAMRVLKKDGVLFLNLGDCYSKGPEPSTPGLKDKDLMLIPFEVAKSLRDSGYYLRNMIVWDKPNGYPSSVKDFFTPTYEFVIFLAKNKRYFFDEDAVKVPAKAISVERNKYAAKGAVGYVGAGGEQYARRDRGKGAMVPESGLVKMRDVWHIAKGQYRGVHTAVFPEELVRRCILAGSREGDTILDFFGGSGTTAKVSEELGRRSVLIDLNPEYVREAKRRLIR